MSKGNLDSKGLEGFKTLFDTLYPSLCLFANRYLQDLDLSKDLVQEVFIKIWKQQPSLKSQHAIKAYFYTCVKHQCLNLIKSKTYKSQQQSISIDMVQLQSKAHFESEVLTVETYAELYKAIDALPDQASKVIKLALNQYSNKDIAEELSITTSTVRTQKSIAYKKLKVLLQHFSQLFLLF
jgi:RNA polymerase sigma-70 factor (ECF subfamily)